MVEQEFQQKTKELIDSLKSICANSGLGNDGNEFKIITQTFLYKFLNDKFKTPDIYLKQLNYRFIVDFEQYLLRYRR